MGQHRTKFNFYNKVLLMFPLTYEKNAGHFVVKAINETCYSNKLPIPQTQGFQKKTQLFIFVVKKL
jgi:hypothetical protein